MCLYLSLTVHLHLPLFFLVSENTGIYLLFMVTISIIEASWKYICVRLFVS